LRHSSLSRPIKLSTRPFCIGLSYCPMGDVPVGAEKTLKMAGVGKATVGLLRSALRLRHSGVPPLLSFDQIRDERIALLEPGQHAEEHGHVFAAPARSEVLRPPRLQSHLEARSTHCGLPDFYKLLTLHWLADVLARIADTPQTKLRELLPWKCLRHRLSEALASEITIADKGSTPITLCDKIVESGGQPLIPPKRHRRFKSPYDPELYRSGTSLSASSTNSVPPHRHTLRQAARQLHGPRQTRRYRHLAQIVKSFATPR
jgi:hypothetical protein